MPNAHNPELTAALAVLEAQVAADVAAHAAPGLSIAVVHGDDATWARGFGLADIDRRWPAGPEIVYPVGSITKLFTATMLMQLRDAGKLRLDDPVQGYLADVRVPHRHPGTPEITFRHLVTHTAGLPKDGSFDYWETGQFAPADQVLAALTDSEQPYSPGVRWKYSNFGVAVLGHILARIAGMPWAAYVEERILRPLGMTSSAPELTPALRPLAATGYARPVDGWPPATLPRLDVAGTAPAGGLHSTVTDLARFMGDQFSPEPRLLRRSSVEEMQRIQWLNPDWLGGQAIGWAIQRAADGTTWIGHGGSIHGFTGRMTLSPADRLGVVVLANSSDSAACTGVATQALQLLTPVLRRLSGRRLPARLPVAPAAWQRYVGLYRWVFDDAEVALRDGHVLLLVRQGTVLAEVPLEPEGEHTFAMATGPDCGERLRFVVAGDGAVVRMWVGPRPYDRV